MTDEITSYSNKKAIDKVSKYFGKKSANLVFIIHGFRNDGSETWMEDLRNALHGKYESKDIVIGLVDWRWGE